MEEKNSCQVETERGDSPNVETESSIPHRLQNLEEASLSVAQSLHLWTLEDSDTPHAGQYAASMGILIPQFGHLAVV